MKKLFLLCSLALLPACAELGFSNSVTSGKRISDGKFVEADIGEIVSTEGGVTIEIRNRHHVDASIVGKLKSSQTDVGAVNRVNVDLAVSKYLSLLFPPAAAAGAVMNTAEALQAASFKFAHSMPLTPGEQLALDITGNDSNGGITPPADTVKARLISYIATSKDAASVDAAKQILTELEARK